MIRTVSVPTGPLLVNATKIVLEPNTKVLYIHSSKWIKSHESGIRWDDKVLDINWPLKVSDMSQKDKNLPFWEENEFNL